MVCSNIEHQTSMCCQTGNTCTECATRAPRTEEMRFAHCRIKSSSRVAQCQSYPLFLQRDIDRIVGLLGHYEAGDTVLSSQPAFCPVLLLDDMNQVVWASSESDKPFPSEGCQQCRASSAACVLLKSSFLPEKRFIFPQTQSCWVHWCYGKVLMLHSYQQKHFCRI